MHRLFFIVTLCVLPLAAACSTGLSGGGVVVRHEDPRVAARDAEIRRATARRTAHARALARESLARVASAKGPTERRAAIMRARTLARSVLTDPRPEALAAIAPDVLRVYDVGEMIADGPNVPRGTVFGMLAPDQRATPGLRDESGAPGVARRVARLLRESDPDAWGGATFAFAAGESVVVLQDPARFAEVERTLDRLATVGGGVAHVRLAVVATGAPRGAGSPSAVTFGPGQFDAAVDALRNGGRDGLSNGRHVTRVRLDVPYGRERSAIRGEQVSYLQDFDVDVGSGMADPRIGTLLHGAALSGSFGASGEAGSPDRELTVHVGWSRLVFPLEEFTTSLAPDRPPVRIQIPTLQALTFSGTTIAADEQIARFVTWDGHELVVGVTLDPGSQPRPAWTRVAPGRASQATALDAPLLEDALRLAALYVEAGNASRAALEMRFALASVETPVWRRRVRPSAETAEGMLVRWPVPGDASESDVRESLADAGVAVATGYGFLDVRDGLVLGCIAVESADALATAIGAIERRARAARAPPAATFDRDGLDMNQAVLSASSTSLIAFVQDFDVEVARGMAIADPVIGNILEGATVRAFPVPSAPRGTFDVEVTHSVLVRPIPTIETSLSRGGPITIQLPRMRLHTTWRRVVVEPGGVVSVTSAVQNPSAEPDAHEFLLRGLPR